MVEFMLFVVGACFAFLFVGVCWTFILLGCLLEFVRCVLTFHFVDMPERLQSRASELRKCGYDLSQLCVACFEIENDNPPCCE